MVGGEGGVGAGVAWRAQEEASHLRGVGHERKAQRIGATLLDAVWEVGTLTRRRLLHLQSVCHQGGWQ